MSDSIYVRYKNHINQMTNEWQYIYVRYKNHINQMTNEWQYIRTLQESY